MQEKRIRELNTYTDSLRFYNQELNARLNSFIIQLDGQAQNAFQYREQKIAEAQKHSFRLIAGLVGAAIILLVISHFVIVRDLRRRDVSVSRVTSCYSSDTHVALHGVKTNRHAGI